MLSYTYHGVCHEFDSVPRIHEFLKDSTIPKKLFKYPELKQMLMRSMELKSMMYCSSKEFCASMSEIIEE